MGAWPNGSRGIPGMVSARVRSATVQVAVPASASITCLNPSASSRRPGRMKSGFMAGA